MIPDTRFILHTCVVVSRTPPRVGVSSPGRRRQGVIARAPPASRDTPRRRARTAVDDRDARRFTVRRPHASDHPRDARTHARRPHARSVPGRPRPRRRPPPPPCPRRRRAPRPPRRASAPRIDRRQNPSSHPASRVAPPRRAPSSTVKTPPPTARTSARDRAPTCACVRRA